MTSDVSLLSERLASAGLRPITRLRVTENRTVLVSLSRHRVLSVHRAFVDAPDEVLHAIARFVGPGARRDHRLEAQRTILAHHAEWLAHSPVAPVAQAPARRPERRRPGDDALLERLALQFAEYNRRHFAETLPAIPIRLSGRMHTRLGHLLLDEAGKPVEITISRRHFATHGWDEVAHTLLHEMVHLWQCANGHAVDHGSAFRAKARETGVQAAARRWVRPTRRRRPAVPTHHAPRTTHQESLTLI